MKHEELIKKEVPQDDSTSHEEKMILYNEIKKYKPVTVVETGTHRGLTALYMAHALWEVDQGILHTADPYEWGAKGNFRKFPDLEKHIQWYQKRGSEMIKELPKIDFAFIDGYHEKEEVLEELDVLLPNLAEGAVVYFHDTNGRNEYCDVIGALEERNLQVEYIKTQNGLAKYIHKTSVGVDAKATPHKKTVGKSTAGKRADKLPKSPRKKRAASGSRKSTPKRKASTK